ncbi:MAG: hypothetical protein J6W28_01290, partial [Clostridia bacterium]|nr:hypothetical protein [Clostridia bacterium]
MKKRILSLFLLVVLLVTAIPVMTISATEGEQQANTTEYYKWFVGAEKGPAPTNAGTTLVGNFTAFANETDAYDNSKPNGQDKWFNKVEGGASATLYSTIGNWGPTEYGGGLTAGIKTNANYNAGVNDSLVAKNIRIEFSTAWSSAADAFVETSAVLTGIPGSSSAALINTSDKEETFRFDLLRGVIQPGINNTEGLTLGMVWRARASQYFDTAGRSLNFRAACGIAISSSTDRSNFAPGGLTMFMKKTTTEAGVSYSIGYNNDLVKTAAANSDTGVGYNDGIEYLDADAYAALNTAIPPLATKFTMFNRAPMDVYTVRVYTGGALTDAERAYNHLIDLLGFYQVAIPEGVTADRLMDIASLFKDTIFVYENAEGKGAANHADVKAQLKAAVATLVAYDYDALYAAQDHLIGLYTAFGTAEPTCSLSAGKWYNKMGGENITIRVTDSKFSWVDGVLGKGGIALAGVTSGRANNADTGNYASAYGNTGLDLPMAWMDKGDLTVETSSIVYGAPDASSPSHSWPGTPSIVIDVLRAYYAPNPAHSNAVDGSLHWTANYTHDYFWQTTDDFTW